ncbi:MAG TPA: helix-turn-helix transcriptional regulator [Chitinophagales bacterium]|nr:helix-turn-helix transcriptional regulator [Chitinophagales bacterium]
MYGEKIRTIRDIKGFSQEYVAKQLHITPQAYSKIELNKTALDEEKLRHIATVFGVSVDEIKNFDNQKYIFSNNTNNKDSFHINENGRLLENIVKLISNQNNMMQVFVEKLDKITDKLIQ